MYTEIHFYIQCKTQKAPPKRSLKFVSKNANGVRGLSWSAFGGVASPRPYKSRVPEGVFLPDFLSTTFESTFSEGFFSNSLIFNEVA